VRGHGRGRSPAISNRLLLVAPDEGLADRLVGEERGVLRDSEFVEGLEACTQEDAGVGEVVDAVLVVVAGLRTVRG